MKLKSIVSFVFLSTITAIPIDSIATNSSLSFDNTGHFESIVQSGIDFLRQAHGLSNGWKFQAINGFPSSDRGRRPEDFDSISILVLTADGSSVLSADNQGGNNWELSVHPPGSVPGAAFGADEIGLTLEQAFDRMEARGISGAWMTVSIHFQPFEVDSREPAQEPCYAFYASFTSITFVGARTGEVVRRRLRDQVGETTDLFNNITTIDTTTSVS